MQPLFIRMLIKEQNLILELLGVYVLAILHQERNIYSMIRLPKNFLHLWMLSFMKVNHFLFNLIFKGSHLLKIRNFFQVCLSYTKTAFECDPGLMHVLFLSSPSHSLSHPQDSLEPTDFEPMVPQFIIPNSIIQKREGRDMLHHSRFTLKEYNLFLSL